MGKDSWRIAEFVKELREREKCENTIGKYVRDVKKFLEFSHGEISRRVLLLYKEELMREYKVSSVNSMLVALNCYLKFLGEGALCLKICRVQRKIFVEEERELKEREYRRLVLTARKQGNERLCCILQTVAGTGIRIGELSYITREALRDRKVRIDLKGKIREIILPRSLTVMLMDYCRKMNIRSGPIFITRSGKPMDRRNIWAEMKALGSAAGVLLSKIFPHNLRHLFARTFYEREKDLTRLADYLGHSNVETTRRYTRISSTEACEKCLELGLLVTG